jgi:hypothetical protein
MDTEDKLNPTIDDSIMSLAQVPLNANGPDKIFADVDPSQSMISMSRAKRSTIAKPLAPRKDSSCQKLINFVWMKKDYALFNTVSKTLLINFTALQSIRALCFITLSITFGIFFFIKVT